MGLCGGPQDVEEVAISRKSQKFLRQISMDSNELNSTRKLLLLGAGESGKSTVFKQIRIINSAGYSESELKQFKWIIHRNVLDAIKILVEQVHARDIELAEANEDIADQVVLWDSENLNPEMAESISRLWADPGVQQIFERRAEFQIGDNAHYFLADVRRIGAHDYTPTTADALSARVRTSGVVSKNFDIKGAPHAVYDVGGQRSERRNWLPLFDHVTAIVFVAAISEYDQVVAEDRSKNRMHEALDLFTQVVNSKHFGDAAVMIFLNKKDLFAEKIKRVDPGTWFPDYKGGCNYEAAEAYFKQEFHRRVEDKHKKIYTYTTCATDTGNIKVVLDSVSDIYTSISMEAGVGF